MLSIFLKEGANARNEGVQRIKGEFVQFVDGDDYSKKRNDK